MRLGWLTIAFAGVWLLAACAPPEPTLPNVTPTRETPTPTTMPTPTATPAPIRTPTSAALDREGSIALNGLAPTPTPIIEDRVARLEGAVRRLEQLHRTASPSPVPITPSPTATPTQTPTPTLPSDPVARGELFAVSEALKVLILANNLLRFSHPASANTAPCTTGTQHMTQFPDQTALVGSADKLLDPDGNEYIDGVDPLGDKDGYLLVGHDITGDNAQTSLVDYISVTKTAFCYTINPDGTLGQYTVDSVHIGEVASFEAPS